MKTNNRLLSYSRPPSGGLLLTGVRAMVLAVLTTLAYLGILPHAEASFSVYNSTDDYQIVVNYIEIHDGGDVFYNEYLCSTTLNPGESINLNDYYGYHEMVSFVEDYEDWIYIGNPGGGGGGGGEEPPLVDGGVDTYFDDNGNWVLIGANPPMDSRWKQVTRGGATLRMQSEDKTVAAGQVISSGSSQVMPSNAGAAYRFDGMGTLSVSDIAVEPVPGQNNTFRGTTLDITLKNVFAFNPSKFDGSGGPSVGSKWAEYQHYHEFSSRLEVFAEKIKTILETERFGGTTSTKNAILLEIKQAYNEFVTEADSASKRFDSAEQDPNDEDVGSHRGDLSRPVRVPDTFYYYWDWNEQ